MLLLFFIDKFKNLRQFSETKISIEEIILSDIPIIFTLKYYQKFHYSLVRSWTSLYMDGTTVDLFLLIFPHEAGA